MKTSALEQVWEILKRLKQPAFRLRQIEEAWYAPVAGWDAITTLPKALRDELKAIHCTSMNSSDDFYSKLDATHKATLTLEDGKQVASVFMPNTKGMFTVCLSSQVGCAMKCVFCATGKMGFSRNLTTDEMVDQVRFWRTRLIEKGGDPMSITNAVMMGMGEPLANFDEVKKAMQIFLERMGFAPTHVVVSTVAFKGSLERLLTDPTFPDVRVAISLHAGTDETRAKIVPTHIATSLDEVLEFTERYLEGRSRSRHVTFEYVMLHNVNDMPEEAEAFAKRFKRLRDKIKVNLIPWNQTDAELQRSSLEHVDTFQDILRREGYDATVRISKGQDIDAACGQLAVKKSKTEKEAGR